MTDFGMIIGGDIPWEDVVDYPFLYNYHISQASFEGEEIKEQFPGQPYSMIGVKAKGISDGACFPVIHKLDFKNFWTLEQEGYLDKEKYFIVIKHKVPTGIKNIASIYFPRLEYSIYDSTNEKLILQVYDQEWDEFSNI